MPDLELTAEELKNGWTSETLAAYIRERELAQSDAILSPRRQRPRWANHKYDPLRWRR